MIFTTSLQYILGGQDPTRRLTVVKCVAKGKAVISSISAPHFMNNFSVKNYDPNEHKSVAKNGPLKKHHRHAETQPWAFVG